MSANGAVLSLQDVDAYYGLSHILFGVSFEIRDGEIMCLLGRNGAGKTTTIRSIAGLTAARAGRISFMGEDITRLPVHQITRKGIRPAFSDRRVFGDSTVRENLDISRSAPAQSGAGTVWDYERVYRVFPVLERYEKRWAKTLSGGEQQMLCVASALMGNPKLLLLDEPTTGLSPLVVDAMRGQILDLKKEGISILLAEQNVRFATDLGDRCCIIDVGEIRFQGRFEELLKNDHVVRTYLAV